MVHQVQGKLLLAHLERDPPKSSHRTLLGFSTCRRLWGTSLHHKEVLRAFPALWPQARMRKMLPHSPTVSNSLLQSSTGQTQVPMQAPRSVWRSQGTQGGGPSPCKWYSFFLEVLLAKPNVLTSGKWSASPLPAVTPSSHTSWPEWVLVTDLRDVQGSGWSVAGKSHAGMHCTRCWVSRLSEHIPSTRRAFTREPSLPAASQVTRQSYTASLPFPWTLMHPYNA